MDVLSEIDNRNCYQYGKRDRLTEISAFGEVSTSAAPEVKERYYAALARQPSRHAP